MLRRPPPATDSTTSAPRADASSRAQSGPAIRKIIYLVTEDWYFCSHRLPIARAMRDAGAEVLVACRVRDHGDRILEEGFKLRPLRWRRRGDGLFGSLRALVEIFRLYRTERPDVVHHVALKPVVFGSIAAFAARTPKQVNLIAGLGFLFVEPTLPAFLQRAAILWCMRWFAGGRDSRIIVQNQEDRSELIERRVFRPSRIDLVPGSGVNLRQFPPQPDPGGDLIVGAMVCRMLRYKGVGVAVEAARRLRRAGLPFKLLLVGPIDPENPSSHTREELEAWQGDGAVEWLGLVTDVSAVWARAHICVFPSLYREGIPKALLEAAASARPIVTTDIPGCRDVVIDGKNGYLVPQNDPVRLADAIAELVADRSLRETMGKAARDRVVSSFSEEIIVSETLNTYSVLCGTRVGSEAHHPQISPADPVPECAGQKPSRQKGAAR